MKVFLRAVLFGAIVQIASAVVLPAHPATAAGDKEGGMGNAGYSQKAADAK